MDGSSPKMDAEKDIVDEILDELGAGGIPVIEVMNKMDLNEDMPAQLILTEHFIYQHLPARYEFLLEHLKLNLREIE